MYHDSLQIEVSFFVMDCLKFIIHSSEGLIELSFDDILEQSKECLNE